MWQRSLSEKLAARQITNAIADMRTYGEGFIIADQAPGLLDPAVIRNTNTKIVFSLPELNDRQLVGKAQNLNTIQIDELARLGRGVASVYQNNWQESVLCQFKKIRPDSIFPFKYTLENEIEPDSRTQAFSSGLFLLLRSLFGQQESNVVEKDQQLINTYYPELMQQLQRCRSEEEYLAMLKEYLKIDEAIKVADSFTDFKKWRTSFLQQIAENLIFSSENDKLLFLRGVFKVLTKKHPTQKTFWEEQYNQHLSWSQLL